MPASFFPDLLINEDTGDLPMPTNYCGLRVSHVGGIWWHDGDGDVVEAEVHGEVTASGGGLYFMGEEVTEYYLGGVDFTGALDTCDENDPWHFPTPLSYGGNAPQFGAQRLVLDLDQPSYGHSIEFLDNAFDAIELPDLYEDWEPPADWEDYCEKIPEFCEEEEDPDSPVKELDIIWGCILEPHKCPTDPGTKPLGLTLGCAALSSGCNPDPRPPSTLVIQNKTSQETEILVPLGTPQKRLAP